MKKTLSRLAFLTLCLTVLSITSIAQNSQDSIRSQVETLDGNEYIGIILEQNTQTIRIKTDKLGEISIPQVEVKRITQLSTTKSIDGTYWPDNPQATRYFWSPNGYNLKAGEGYYQNVWIMINQAVYGFTDHFSAGVGMIPTFLIAGASTPAWLMAKFSMPVVKDKLNLGVGALAGTVIGEENINFGILYGISTFGSKDRNINFGLGWLYGDGKFAKIPTINISGMFRVAPKAYLMTENYVIAIPDEETMVLTMVGARFMIKHVGLDFGLVHPFLEDMSEFVAIPWLGLNIPFGQKGTAIKK